LPVAVGVLIFVALCVGLVSAHAASSRLREMSPSPSLRTGDSGGLASARAASSAKGLTALAEADGRIKGEHDEEAPERWRHAGGEVRSSAAKREDDEQDPFEKDNDTEAAGQGDHHGNGTTTDKPPSGSHAAHKEQESRPKKEGSDQKDHHEEHHKVSKSTQENDKETHSNDKPKDTGTQPAEAVKKSASPEKPTADADLAADSNEHETVLVSLCATAMAGDACFKAVRWAQTEGIVTHPEWYGNLTESSSFSEFQEWLHKGNFADCEAPCGEPCLCAFDADRTLTTRPGYMQRCEGTAKVPGVNDSASVPGTLVLSAMAQNIQGTFCKRCYRGIVSAGDIGGLQSDERGVLGQMLGGHQATVNGDWSDAANVLSLLVVHAGKGAKQEIVRRMVDWLRSSNGVDIKDRDVHFFDDEEDNIWPFEDTGFNARQVSCASRDDGGIGLCGGGADEVEANLGVRTC